MKLTAGMGVVLLACELTTGSALAQLRAGDVAVVGFNTHGADEFAWVALRSIPANTTINFTDSSVSNGWFRWTEHLGDAVATPGPLRWSHTNALPVGSVVRWIFGAVTNWSVGRAAGGRMDLSQDGDQIIVYTGSITNSGPADSPWRGDPSAATMLFALDFANNGWGLVSNKETSTSMIPSGVSTNDGTAVYVGKKSDGYYSGPRTGTVMELRGAIANPTNWTTGLEAFSPTVWVESFTVTNTQSGTSFTMK